MPEPEKTIVDKAIVYGLLVIIVGALFGFTMVAINKNKESDAKAAAEAEREKKVIIMEATNLLTGQFKFASFPDAPSEYQVTKISEGVWAVSGWAVNADATYHIHWSMKMEQQSDGTWKLMEPPSMHLEKQ